MGKNFSELSTAEAEALAKKCLEDCRSETEIRDALTAAGFDGEGAAVATASDGSNFMYMVMVEGPNGEDIDI